MKFLTITLLAIVASIAQPARSANYTLNDLTVGKTVHGPDLAVNEMKGNIVYVVYWGAHCGECVGLLLPKLNTMYKKYSDQGVHFVGLEIEKVPDSEVENVAHSKRIGFQITTDGSVKGWSGSWPHGMLFGPDGKLVADNPPLKELDGKIKELLDEANSIPTGAGPYVKLAALETQIKAGQNLGPALKSLALKKDGKDSMEAAEAQMMYAAANGRAQELFDAAVSLENAKPVAAIAKFDKLALRFEGSDIGTKSRKEAEKLKSDPKVRKEVEADGMYKQLQALCDGMKSVPGSNDPKSDTYRRANGPAIQSVVAGCQTIVQRYPGTGAAAKAEELLGEYR